MKRKLYSLLGLLLLGGIVGCSNNANTPTNEPSELPQTELPTEKPSVKPTEKPSDDDLDIPTIDFKNEFKITGDNYLNKTAVDDNNRVFYEIFTGSFSDSNGDGIGDLRGIINRLDYLNDGDPNSGKSLGIGGIWLTPIFTSPTYHKYDVTNYYEIDDDFGTMADLKELISECHERDIKLILDLPLNHTSTQNDMFLKFKEAHLTNDVYNPYYHYYSHYNEGSIAPANRKFNKLTGTNLYYECNFSETMPELNFDVDEVRTECVNIAKNYLDMGIDGFRFDAAKYVYMKDEESNSEFWSWYMNELRTIKSDIYAVAEVWDTDDVAFNYYDSKLGCFNFSMSGPEGQIASAIRNGNASRYVNYVEAYINRIKTNYPEAIIHPFIANHDNDRCAGYLTPKSNDAHMAANLMLLGPGSPFIYYGEEIGLKGTRGSSNTDANRRLRMRWGDNDTVQSPVGYTYKDSKQTNGTVFSHISDESSLYTHYKKAIMIRNANPEIARGTYQKVTTANLDVAGFKATYNNSTALVLHNVSDKPYTLDLSSISLDSFKVLRATLGKDMATLANNKITIPAKSSVVLK